MSHTFSRRAFFKYTAAAAVAVAGASLLSGCNNADPKNPVQSSLGKSCTVMQITGILDDFDVQTGVFQFSVKSSRQNPEFLDTEQFVVRILSADSKTVKYYSHEIKLVEVVDGFKHAPTIEKGDTATLKLQGVDYVPPEAGDIVFVTYIPVPGYPSYTMSWKLKQDDATDTTDPDDSTDSTDSE